GIHFRDDRFDLRDGELDQAAPDLRDVYHCELADIRQYHVHGKHAALHADEVPDFYSVRAPWRKSFLARCDYRLVAPFSRPLHQFVHSRRVGLLKVSRRYFDRPTSWFRISCVSG